MCMVRQLGVHFALKHSYDTFTFYIVVKSFYAICIKNLGFGSRDCGKIDCSRDFEAKNCCSPPLTWSFSLSWTKSLLKSSTDEHRRGLTNKWGQQTYVKAVVNLWVRSVPLTFLYSIHEYSMWKWIKTIV